MNGAYAPQRRCEDSPATGRLGDSGGNEKGDPPQSRRINEATNRNSRETRIMKQNKTETEKFDFKKAQRELIRRELRPILYEHGFVLCRPTTYIRERGGLLQEFYFKVEVSKLRPWVSYRPVFDTRPIGSFGSDGPTGAKYEDPYRGFCWCSIDHWFSEDNVLKEKEYQRQFLPAFEALKSSIVNGLLPEMDAMRSMDDFIQLHEFQGRLFGKTIHAYDGSGQYFSFISDVHTASGKRRMELICSEMSGAWLPTLPKNVREYLEARMGLIDTDSEADRIFHEYCNQVRTAYKLDVK